jgi:hypothetical protein
MYSLSSLQIVVLAIVIYLFKTVVLPACLLYAVVTPVFKKEQHLNLKIIVQFLSRAFVV